MNRYISVFVVCALSLAYYAYARYTFATPDIMKYLYPILFGTHFIFAIIRLLHLYLQGLLADRWADVAYMLAASLSFSLLGLVTGSAPVMDIDIIRPYLVDSRFLIMLILVPMLAFEMHGALSRVDVKK